MRDNHTDQKRTVSNESVDVIPGQVGEQRQQQHQHQHEFPHSGDISSVVGPNRVKDFDELMDTYAPEKNKTYPIMTRFERAKILGLRTEQIARGADPMIDGDWTGMSPSDIAQEELDAKATPFIIVRNLPDGSRELWRVRDLTVL